MKNNQKRNRRSVKDNNQLIEEFKNSLYVVNQSIGTIKSTNLKNSRNLNK